MGLQFAAVADDHRLRRRHLVVVIGQHRGGRQLFGNRVADPFRCGWFRQGKARQANGTRHARHKHMHGDAQHNTRPVISLSVYSTQCDCRHDRFQHGMSFLIEACTATQRMPFNGSHSTTHLTSFPPRDHRESDRRPEKRRRRAIRVRRRRRRERRPPPHREPCIPP